MKNKTTLQIILLVVITFLAYFNTLSNGFVWDDQYLVQKNPYIKDAKYIPDYFAKDNWMLSAKKYRTGYLRPVFLLSLLFDFKLWGANPFGYHLNNLILHILCVLLLYFLALKIFKANFFAFLAALFFALHPIHTESVACISDRVDIEATIFGILSLLLFIKGQVKKPLYYFASVLCFILALLSKEVAIVVPLLILLYDFYFIAKPKSVSQLLNRYSGFIIATLIYAIWRLMIFPGGYFIEKGFKNIIGMPNNSYFRFLSSIKTVAEYLRLLVLPTGLSLGRILQAPKSIFEPNLLISLAIIIILLTLTIKLFRRNRIISFALSWIFIALIPYSNLIPVGGIFAERNLYLASVGFCLLLAAAFQLMFTQTDKKIKDIFSTNSLRLFIILICLFYFQETFSRNFDWKNDISIWRSAVKVNPQNTNAHICLGSAYNAAGNLELAEQELVKAAQIGPQYGLIYYNLGALYSKNGLYQDSLKAFEIALLASPQDPLVYGSIGRTYNLMKKTDKAIWAFQKALSLDPDDLESNYDLGLAYYNQNKLDLALQYFEKTIEVDKYFANGYYGIALVLLKQGFIPAARRNFQKVKEISPNFDLGEFERYLQE